MSADASLIGARGLVKALGELDRGRRRLRGCGSLLDVGYLAVLGCAGIWLAPRRMAGRLLT